MLLVDGVKVADGRIANTVANRYSLDETFDVGEDTGTAVIADYSAKMPFRFTGTLEKLTIDLKGQAAPGTIAAAVAASILTD